PLRICLDPAPHPPLFYPDRDGTLQVLIKMTAARLGIDAAFHFAPPERCREELRQGAADAAGAAAFVPENQSVSVFPMKGDQADTGMSLAVVRGMVYRRRGSDAAWDGRQFTHLRKPVLVPAGHAVFLSKLKAMHAPYDNGAQTARQNLYKLLAERGDLVILLESDGKQELTSEIFAGKIDALPAPFIEEHFYFAFSRAYYDADPERAKAIWKTMTAVRKSREYKQAVRNIR
ncbi:MAG: hypothetical protein ACM3WS_03140, partial [Bacillota bacterium]